MSELYKRSLLDVNHYTSCFCEENIYKLSEAAFLLDNSSTECQSFVIFISSKNTRTPIWCQKSSETLEDPVCWDYHVILCVKGIDQNRACFSLVFDHDSRLFYPTTLMEYITKSFKPEMSINLDYQQ